MKSLTGLMSLLMVSLLLVGCQGYQSQPGEKAVAGTVIGAVGGGLIGSTIGHGTGTAIAVTTGALLGGLIGHEIGDNMDEMEKTKVEKTFYHATQSEIGETHYWNDKVSGHSGSIRPIRDGMYEGLYCREFQTTVYIDGRVERMYGTACRTRDGKWVPVR